MSTIGDGEKSEGGRGKREGEGGRERENREERGGGMIENTISLSSKKKNLREPKFFIVSHKSKKHLQV